MGLNSGGICKSFEKKWKMKNRMSILELVNSGRGGTWDIPRKGIKFILSLHNKLSQNLTAPNNKDVLSVSVFQEFGRNLAGLLWPKVSHEVAVKISARAAGVRSLIDWKTCFQNGSLGRPVSHHRALQRAAQVSLQCNSWLPQSEGPRRDDKEESARPFMN